MVHNTEYLNKTSSETASEITQEAPSSDNDRRFHSNYICPDCGGLLYTELNDGSDICINPDCRHFPQGAQFAEPSREGIPWLHDGLETAHTRLVKNIKECDPVQLTLYTYLKRKALISLALHTGVIPSISDFLSLSELLITLNANPPKGNNRDQQFFEFILQQMKKRTEYLNFIDDMENERLFVWPSKHDGARIFALKYPGVIRGIYKGNGMPSLSSLSVLFEFQDIHALVAENVQPAPADDYTAFLDNLWPHVLALKYVFSINSRTSKQYDYKPDNTDIAALLDLYFTLSNNDTSIIPVSQFQEHFNKWAKGAKQFSKFLNQYVDSISRVPIAVRARDSVIVDRLTLLYFIMYLHGQYRAESTGRKASERTGRKKQELGEVFEGKLRERMFECGYSGPGGAIHEKFDYDILMISEAKKRIIMADTSFRDPSPPFISGHTPVQQELMDQSQGLLAEADRQWRRLKYFKHEPEKFRRYLNPQTNWKEYEVGAYLVTRYIPLIDWYRDTRIISASDFISSEL